MLAALSKLCGSLIWRAHMHIESVHLVEAHIRIAHQEHSDLHLPRIFADLKTKLGGSAVREPDPLQSKEFVCFFITENKPPALLDVLWEAWRFHGDRALQ